jgi:AraC-like DNA-binding protein
VLAERFRHFLGVPPMAYLTHWRMQFGAQLLTSTSHSVAQISAEVGYESDEPAFNRAFKREFGFTARALSYEIQSRRRPLVPHLPAGDGRTMQSNFRIANFPELIAW